MFFLFQKINLGHNEIRNFKSSIMNKNELTKKSVYRVITKHKAKIDDISHIFLIKIRLDIL